MILTVGNVKGGVGKTTLAVNLAITPCRAARDILLIDGDEQGTAAAFTELRMAEKRAVTENGARAKKSIPDYTAMALQGAAIRTQVRRLAPKYSVL